MQQTEKNATGFPLGFSFCRLLHSHSPVFKQQQRVVGSGENFPETFEI
jgi:hypothetical protein